MNKIRFTKMHGCGNDYIYVNVMQNAIINPSAAAIAWSDRHKGIGSDGLVLIDKSPIPEADFSMRIFNADGSEAMMCGNASRCIGKYLYERGLTSLTEIRLLTLSGVKTLGLHVTDGIVESVTVDMLEPALEDESQFDSSRDLDLGTFVSMGNPHAVVFTDLVDVLDIEKVGPKFEYDPLFPERVNTEFVKIIDDHTIKMRVWERGSGETMACGTGACAAAVAAVLNGYCPKNEDIRVILKGGDLVIRYTDSTVFMTGNCAKVFEGRMEI